LSVERVTGRTGARPLLTVRSRLARWLATVPMSAGRVAFIVWSYLGIGAVVIAATVVLFPVTPEIALPFTVPGIDARAVGIALWILVGIATSSRGTAEEGRTAITLGVAPVVASFALGGPVAGVWVAAIGSLELRELRREIPWYAVLANRAVLAVPAALGGILTYWLRGLDLGPSQLVDFLEVMAGAALFAALNLALAVLAVWARTGRGPTEAIGVPWRTVAIMMAAESSLAWIFAAAYVAIAWWSPAGLVIADTAAAASVDRGRADWLLRHHQLTLLPNRLSLTEHAADLRRSGRTGTCVFYIDLDGFKAVNDTYDHGVGDDVLQVVGTRLSAIKRNDDFLAHLHGDEFVLLAAGVETDAEAEGIVERVTRAIEEPIEHEVGTITISASLGYRMLSDGADLDAALQHADRGMAAAKRERHRRTGQAPGSGRRRTSAMTRPVDAPAAGNPATLATAGPDSPARPR
jgi:diguanylate cyclase (GGDEF)-like protein